MACLDDADLGGDVESVTVLAETDVSLLCAIRTDEGVDLHGLHLVHLLNSGSDGVLVGTDIHDENEGVVILNLLHGALGCERIAKNGKLIELVHARSRSARIKRRLWLLISLRATEVHGCVHLLCVVSMLCTSLHSLCGLHSLVSGLDHLLKQTMLSVFQINIIMLLLVLLIVY